MRTEQVMGLVLAVMIPAIIYVLWNGFPIELIGQRMAYALDSFPLVAVPVFIFVGNLMNQSGITERIYRFATTLVGRVPGELHRGQAWSPRRGRPAGTLLRARGEERDDAGRDGQ